MENLCVLPTIDISAALLCPAKGEDLKNEKTLNPYCKIIIIIIVGIETFCFISLVRVIKQ